MPTFKHHGASIYYEEFGKGFPIQSRSGRLCYETVVPDYSLLKEINWFADGTKYGSKSWT
ncbi:MAG: hypothetical protein HYU44_04540 [Betaproteobacteria bacterium]|nr:hypothetical protein [Betaproteobacteria bacterium]MBI3056661.1 hypothetical protein [Betaproteobacteria bacterium]